MNGSLQMDQKWIMIFSFGHLVCHQMQTDRDVRFCYFLIIYQVAKRTAKKESGLREYATNKENMFAE